MRVSLVKMCIQVHFGVLSDTFTAEVAHKERLITHTEHVESSVQQTCIETSLLMDPRILKVAKAMLARNRVEHSVIRPALCLVFVFTIADCDEIVHHPKLVIDALQDTPRQFQNGSVNRQMLIVRLNQLLKSLILVIIGEQGCLIH